MGTILVVVEGSSRFAETISFVVAPGFKDVTWFEEDLNKAISTVK